MLKIKTRKSIIRLPFVLIFTITLCCFSPSILKGQDYYNQENFGNRSILLSGNVTGSVDDLGLTFYNPSRLALIYEPNFTINTKAYQMGSIKIENVFGRSNKLSDSKFEGIPSMVAGTFKLGKSDKHKFAYAILSREKSNVSLGFKREIDAKIVAEYDNEERFVAELNLNDKESYEWFGFSWASKLKDNFAIGVSTFVSVYEFNGRYNLSYSRLDTQADVEAMVFQLKFRHFSHSSLNIYHFFTTKVSLNQALIKHTFVY